MEGTVRSGLVAAFGGGGGRWPVAACTTGGGTPALSDRAVTADISLSQLLTELSQLLTQVEGSGSGEETVVSVGYGDSAIDTAPGGPTRDRPFDTKVTEGGVHK